MRKKYSFLKISISYIDIYISYKSIRFIEQLNLMSSDVLVHSGGGNVVR